MEKHTYGTGLIGNCSYIAHIEKKHQYQLALFAPL